jgi:hypothetical protein
VGFREVIRRISGQRLGEFFAAHIAARPTAMAVLVAQQPTFI